AIREWVGIHTDIDDRKRAEVALHEAKEVAESAAARTRLIVETAHQAFIAMNTDGLIVDWTSQAEATFGWSRAEALGRPLATTIVPEAHRSAHLRGVQRFLDTGKGPVLNRRLELTGRHRDGHEFPIEITISPLETPTGYVFNAFLHDISDRKRAEEE